MNVPQVQVCWKCSGTGYLSKTSKKQQGGQRPCPVCSSKRKPDASSLTSVSAKLHRICGNDATHNFKVGIVGGGIGGLALGVILQRLGVQFHIFEKDDRFGCRKQGYGLTLQQGSRVLQKLGVSISGVSSKAHYVFDHVGNIVGYFGRVFTPSKVDKTCTKHKRVNLHVPRQHLRKVLLDHVNPSNVSFGHAVCDVRQVGNEMSLGFDSRDDRKSFNLVVGCDGIHSKMRKFRSDLLGKGSLQYLGVMVILGISLSCPDLCRERVLQSSDGETRFYTMPFTGELNKNDELPTLGEAANSGLQQNDQGKPRQLASDHIDFVIANDRELDSNALKEIRETYLEGAQETTMWQLSFLIPVDEIAGYTQTLGLDSLSSTEETSARLRQEALQRCEQFHETIRNLIRDTPVHLLSGHPTYDRECIDPDELSAPSMPLTLLGDAVHPMSPFKGQGANQAMVDAVELAERLCNQHLHDAVPLHTVLHQFEQDMVSRSDKKVKASRQAIEPLHSKDVLQPGSEKLQKIVAELRSRNVNASCGGAIDEKVLEIVKDLGDVKSAPSLLQQDRAYGLF